eukprot:gnl/MRDRNA2_/MRDRNA2_206452_c0_seq1.p1 gnl/MRDRNA2_/MRDRNA2_206452_c0~~gnl/MRDRNA2_/MRDRNA2_206452_c0_seq1.p1  ORF type:complete len:286 (-),score=57.63 gnl/MRDRNA2_/MRDRNA2_206452_c0_seq1:234-1052(-)
MAGKGDLLEGLTEDELAEGIALSTSRSFESVMAPLIDLANHAANDVEANAELRWHDVSKKQGCYLVAKKHIKAGEEVRIHYGAKSNARLLTIYGFALPPGFNPHSSIDLQLKVPAGAPADCKSLSSLTLPLGRRRGDVSDEVAENSCSDSTSWRDSDGDGCATYATQIVKKPDSKKEICEYDGGTVKKNCRKTCGSCDVFPTLVHRCGGFQAAAKQCSLELTAWGSTNGSYPGVLSRLREVNSDTSLQLLAAMEEDFDFLQRCGALHAPSKA